MLSFLKMLDMIPVTQGTQTAINKQATHSNTVAGDWQEQAAAFMEVLNGLTSSDGSMALDARHPFNLNHLDEGAAPCSPWSMEPHNLPRAHVLLKWLTEIVPGCAPDLEPMEEEVQASTILIPEVEPETIDPAVPDLGVQLTIPVETSSSLTKVEYEDHSHLPRMMDPAPIKPNLEMQGGFRTIQPQSQQILSDKGHAMVNPEDVFNPRETPLDPNNPSHAVPQSTPTPVARGRAQSVQPAALPSFQTEQGLDSHGSEKPSRGAPTLDMAPASDQKIVKASRSAPDSAQGTTQAHPGSAIVEEESVSASKTLPSVAPDSATKMGGSAVSDDMLATLPRGEDEKPGAKVFAFKSLTSIENQNREETPNGFQDQAQDFSQTEEEKSKDNSLATKSSPALAAKDSVSEKNLSSLKPERLVEPEPNNNPLKNIQQETGKETRGDMARDGVAQIGLKEVVKAEPQTVKPESQPTEVNHEKATATESPRPVFQAEDKAPAEKPIADRLDVIRQIVQRMSLRQVGSQNHMVIRLKPDVLGQLRMQIITENHQVAIRMTAESNAVKSIIEQNLHHLKSELNQHGLEVQKIDVAVQQDNDTSKNGQGTMAFEQSTQGKNGHRKQQQSRRNAGDNLKGSVPEPAASAVELSGGPASNGAAGEVDYFI